MPHNSKEKRNAYERNRRATCPEFAERSRAAKRLWEKSEAGQRYKMDWWNRNRDRLIPAMIARARANRPKENARIAAWRKTMTPKQIANRRQRERERMQTDVAHALTVRMRGRINVALKNQAAGKRRVTTIQYLGCTIKELMAHLESQFLPGMSWKNRSLWHIDHKHPCAAFDLTDPAQQLACFHFSNLQPLWARDNIRKGAKILDRPCCRE